MTRPQAELGVGVGMQSMQRVPPSIYIFIFPALLQRFNEDLDLNTLIVKFVQMD